MPYKQKVTDTHSWNDIPTCKEGGVNLDYVMLRGIFMPSGVSADQIAYFQNLMKKVRETPEWKEFMEKGAFNQTTLAGDEYKVWLAKAEANHRQLMDEAGFLAK
jgi:tripartite-type tricarboxylate transporter receptor subunit TctC